jgi:hypothetical protein
MPKGQKAGGMTRALREAERAYRMEGQVIAAKLGRAWLAGYRVALAELRKLQLPSDSELHDAVPHGDMPSEQELVAGGGSVTTTEVRKRRRRRVRVKTPLSKLASVPSYKRGYGRAKD